MRRALAALSLSAALVLGGCQNPDGSTDWGSTLLLGAGIGTAAALVAGAASDQPRHDGRDHRRYRHPGHGHRGPDRGYHEAGYARGGYGHGGHGPYRRW